MRHVLVGATALLLFGLVGNTSDGVGGEKAPKKRLLVITESKGFRHGCVTRKNNELCLVEKIFHELAAKHGFFEVVCSQESRKEITAENLKNFDAVFFYTTGELPLSETQKADLLAFIRNGKGFMGAHSATDTFYKWKEYGELIGGYFERHPPGTQTVKVIVEDTKHPATKHLGESFTFTDEIYQFKGPYSRDNLRILMRVDVTTTKNQWRKDGDNALAWVREYGKGRVFYTALGHRDEVWQDARFQQHIVGALRYVTGLENADATPSGVKKN